MHKCTLGYQNVGVGEVSHTYLLRCLRYGEKHAIYILIGCGCLQTCKSVVNRLVMWLVLSPNFDGHIYHGYPVM